MLANFEQHCWPVLQVASICYTCQHFGQHFHWEFFIKMLAKMLSDTWQIVPTYRRNFDWNVGLNVVRYIANRTNMLAEMLAKMLAKMLVWFAPTLRSIEIIMKSPYFRVWYKWLKIQTFYFKLRFYVTIKNLSINL